MMLKTGATRQETSEAKKRVAEKIIQRETKHKTKNLLWYCIGLSIILLLLLFMPNIFNNQQSLLSSLTARSPFPRERTIFKYPDPDVAQVQEKEDVGRN